MGKLAGCWVREDNGKKVKNVENGKSSSCTSAYFMVEYGHIMVDITIHK